jgi:hypothetical protein
MQKARKKPHGYRLQPSDYLNCCYCVFHALSCFSNLSSLRTFGSLDNLKFNGVSFLQGAVSVFNYNGVTNKNIGAILTSDEAIALRIVKPLYSPLHLAAHPVEK